ncbi:LexA-binding, inner membrane-associated putative hydrolase [Nonomuraea solani]|uniref:LexA-binding, inner membrane-associated putative hydrolase n=1 Tax=Nonomuraea solani TaxID=1144553 RepID=A0A1H5ZK50_9ACTN|nr:metal-dependent hydrolase [Nonomuraea solani]SEG36135.1 LexA-binding, inner membrane-associated putative hydrolase [Nonomuraea solani]
MMGHTHAMTGAIAWLGLAPPLAALPLVNESSRFIETGIMATALSPAELIAGAIICAGAAMLPDLDHPSATIAQTFGPITWALAKVVAFLSGGHRGATHSLVFAVALGFGTHFLAGTYPIGRDIMVVLLIGLALRAIGVGIPGNKLGSAMVNAGLTAGLFAVFLSLEVGYAWLGLAVAVGCLIHVVGDCMTERGCPVLWPLSVRWVLPWKIGIKTGKKFEQKILAPILSVAIVGLLFWRLAPV